MREIKFRAWHKKDKEMHEVTNLKLPNETENKWIVAMQYTGLKDFKGVEVFEGDIVSTSEHMKPSKEQSKGVVKWNIKKAQWEGFYPSLYPFQIFTVIGNKFENKELLK